jgi:hypothetical protein
VNVISSSNRIFSAHHPNSPCSVEERDDIYLLDSIESEGGGFARSNSNFFGFRQRHVEAPIYLRSVSDLPNVTSKRDTKSNSPLMFFIVDTFKKWKLKFGVVLQPSHTTKGGRQSSVF